MANVAIVCVPFIRSDEHVLYALQTILSLKMQQTSHVLDPIAIINHIRQDSTDLEWIKDYFNHLELNEINNLSRAWNKGMKLAFHRGSDYVLIVNLDVVLHPLCVENLVSYFQKNPDLFIASATEWEDKSSLESAPLKDEVVEGTSFSCFMVDQKLLSKIGPFDEQFGPAYHEDADMAYRLKLQNSRNVKVGSALFWHVDRGTLKGSMMNKDEEFLSSLRKAMDESMVKYEKKWGGLPGNEKFKTPYSS